MTGQHQGQWLNIEPALLDLDIRNILNGTFHY